jgi:hypothetical protein
LLTSVGKLTKRIVPKNGMHTCGISSRKKQAQEKAASRKRIGLVLGYIKKLIGRVRAWWCQPNLNDLRDTEQKKGHVNTPIRKWKEEYIEVLKQCVLQTINRPAHFFCCATKLKNHDVMMDPFDTDSLEVMIDNCCSRTLSGHKSDFIKDTLRTVTNMAVEGYSSTGNLETVTHAGTIRWYIIDDKGNSCEMLIPNSLYVPTNQNRLLSPQHLAQVMGEHESTIGGTRCTTYGDKMVLEWHDLKYKKTVPIDKATANIGRLYTAPGFAKYRAYSSKTKELFRNDSSHGINAFRVKVKQKDEIIVEEGEVIYEPSDRQEDGLIQANLGFKKVELSELVSATDEELKEASSATPEDELLRWHQRLSHVSMARLQKLAARGVLP